MISPCSSAWPPWRRCWCTRRWPSRSRRGTRRLEPEHDGARLDLLSQPLDVRGVTFTARTVALEEPRQTMNAGTKQGECKRVLDAVEDRGVVVEARREAFRALAADQGKAWAELEMLTGRELIDPNAVAATQSTTTRGAK